MTMYEWIPFTIGGDHPPERRCVLVELEPVDTRFGGLPAAIVVGYLRYAAGENDSPYFVTPGIDRGYDSPEEARVLRIATHWCDCLGDDFQAPSWPNKTMNP